MTRHTNCENNDVDIVSKQYNNIHKTEGIKYYHQSSSTENEDRIAVCRR